MSRLPMGRVPEVSQKKYSAVFTVFPAAAMGSQFSVFVLMIVRQAATILMLMVTLLQFMGSVISAMRLFSRPDNNS